MAYQYRLQPTSEQRCLMNCCPVNACPLVVSIAEPREQPDYYSQKLALVPLKPERPEYKDIHSQVLQDLVKRVNLAFEHFIQRRGKPQFICNRARRAKPKQGEDGAYLSNGQAAQSGLNKSFADAGIAGFLNNILPYKAANAGKRVVKVNPAGTSQHCAMCLNRVPKELSDRWHDCPHCGASLPRDVNSGILIKTVGLGQCLRHGEAERLTIKHESGAPRRRSPRRAT